MAENLSETFERFARDECESSSPLYAYLSKAVAKDSDLLMLASHCRRGERIPNLFFAAAHLLLVTGISHPIARYYESLGGAFDVADDPFPSFRDFCLQHADGIRDIIAVRFVQTNEVSRCAGLMPLFAVASQQIAAQPLYLVDIGASAGLNLFWDCYGYKYGEAPLVGDKDSPVQIECVLRGSKFPTLPTAFPAVIGRVGVDLNPLDMSVEEDALWLRALIWPEHQKRGALLRNAIEIARRQLPKLLAGDGAELLPEIMASVPADSVLCIMRIFTQIPKASRERIQTLSAEYGAKRDLVMITARPHGGDDSQLILTTFAKGERTEQGLAYMHNHGDWFEWLGPV